MKYITIMFSAFFVITTIHAQNSITGIWNVGEDNTLIEITEDNGVITGTILSSENAKAKIGNQIIKDVKLSNGEYKGKLYSAKKGEWYDAILKENGDQLDITIKAGWMSKSLTWQKE